ncbi:MAG TPA: YaiO family outer membrane beta-barrel protein [Candidatus Marinimicrobia bacterium]|nr:YaiO family outer membrane beta-barrel protein [Candidatus Neomarinimicrobiota bacterium]
MDTWRRWAVGIQRHKGNWTKIGELQRVERFTNEDYSLAWDNYIALKHNAYINLRAQYAFRQSLLPILDLNAEYYKGLGSLYELSAAYRLMHFPGSDVQFLSLGAAAYLNNEFLRVRLTDILQKASGPELILLAAWRHYFISADHWAELYTVFTKLNYDIKIEEKLRTIGIKGESYPWERIGVQAALSRGWERADSAQWGFMLGLVYRW